MRFTSAGIIVTISAIALAAQTGSTKSPVYVQDGGMRQTLESILIPPMADAPFTCVLHTEWVQNMGDGGTLTLVNQRKIARQSNGRLYQERWILVPKNGSAESKMSHIQIADPSNHTLYACAMGTNVCTLGGYDGQVSTTYKPAEPVTGPLPNGTGYVTRELLGNNVTEGVGTVGARVIRTLNPWAMGNDQALAITREFWFAPSLGINLVSKVNDPRFGWQSFTVTDLKLGEPDEQLFELPKGYQVKDERQTKGAEQ